MSDSPESIQERVLAIKALPLFGGADEADLEQIARKVEVKRFSRGDDLVKEGSPGSAVFFIVSGHCQVHRMVNGARMNINELGPRDFFGEMAVLSPDPRTATVTATDEVVTYVLSAWEFRAAIHSNPQTAMHIMKVLVGRLRRADEEVATLREASAREHARPPNTRKKA